MAATREWIAEFMLAHRERFKPPDWPEPDTEGWDAYERDWVVGMLSKDVREEEAHEASQKLVTGPPAWKVEHIPMVLAMVEHLRRGRGSEATCDDREEQQQLSRDCTHCAGNGLCVVFHPSPGIDDRCPDTATALCVCPYGRWLKRHYAKQDDGKMLRRFVDYDDVLSRRTRWLAQPPRMVDVAYGEASPSPVTARFLAGATKRVEDEQPAF